VPMMLGHIDSPRLRTNPLPTTSSQFHDGGPSSIATRFYIYKIMQVLHFTSPAISRHK